MGAGAGRGRGGAKDGRRLRRAPFAFAAAIALAACAVVAGPALADAPVPALEAGAKGDIILFLGGRAPGPVGGHDLADAIRIEVADLGFSLEERDEPPAGTFAEQLRGVGALLAASRARLALWHTVEPGAGGALDVVLYVVTPRGEATLVKVVRIAAASDPATLRTVALKVRELVRGALAVERSVVSDTARVGIGSVASVGRGPGSSGAAGEGITPPPGEPLARPSGSRVDGPVALATGALAGSFGGLEDWRAGAFLRLGVSLLPALELALGAASFATLHATATRGPATLRETAVWAAARWRWLRTERLHLGASLHAGARVLFVEALVSGSAAARATRATGLAGLEIDARLRLLGRLWVGLSLAGHTTVPREAYQVGGETVFDTGRVHFSSAIFLEVVLP